MRFFSVIAFIAVILTGIVPWVDSVIDDAAFRQDVAFVPGLLAERSGVTASAVADSVRQRAKARKIELLPDGLTVEVSESRKGNFHVVGGVLSVGGSGRETSVQDVTIVAVYDRLLLNIYKRHVIATVTTVAQGDGPGSSYPGAEVAEPQNVRPTP